MSERAEAQGLRWELKGMDELSKRQLYALLALRQEVFVIGQSCLYVDADGLDLDALHLCGYDERGLLCAYLRAFPSREAPESLWKVGRVLVREERRGEGLGQALMHEIIERLRARGIRELKLNAQSYLERFYRELGFERCGPDFDEVGIPHLPMKMSLGSVALGAVAHVIFDLDGTLIDSSYDYALCFEQLALEWGRARPPAEEIRALMFAGLAPQLELSLGALSAEDYERAVERFREICVAHPLTHTQLYPGVIALLDALEGRGYRLSVCTNRPRDLAEQVLEELGLRGRFEHVMGGDDGLERKPSPEMLDELKRRSAEPSEALLMIGDSVVDIEAAHASGLRSAAVTWGYTQTQQLIEARPSALLTHPHELLEALNGAPSGG